jgi:hypothetical protein
VWYRVIRFEDRHPTVRYRDPEVWLLDSGVQYHGSGVQLFDPGVEYRSSEVELFDSEAELFLTGE